MPELPEVESVKRNLAPVLEGAIIKDIELRRSNLRYPFPALFADSIISSKIISLERRAKYILAHMDNNQSLIMHLGMSGHFKVLSEENIIYDKHDHVIFKTHHNYMIIYNDPRRFGLMDIVNTPLWKTHKFFAYLGYEPFSTNLTAEIFHQKLKKRQQSIKVLLLDQTFIVGIGNIYASESLWLSGIDPLRSVNSLTIKETELLLSKIRFVLQRAIEAGGSTLRDHRQPNGESGNFQLEFAVYGRHLNQCIREKCCGIIQKKTQAGRSTYYCNRCQV